MRHTTRRLFSILMGALTLVTPGLLGAETPALGLAAGDVVVEARADGYHLFIRQVPGAQSVMLTEAFEAPDHRLATYALRAAGPNPVNDGEKRLLDGHFLPQPHHSLLSSTPGPDRTLGTAFHVVLPQKVLYGSQTNPNSRYGEVDVQAALATPQKPYWFSIRVFAKPYADYTGAYRDNGFELKTFLAQASRPSSDPYEPGLYEDFRRLGVPYRATGIDDALGRIRRILGQASGTLDLVLAIDTTKSMALNLQAVKAGLLPSLREEVGKLTTFRLGMVFYRDYMEDYLTRSVAFTSDLDLAQHDLDVTVAAGGGDVPEAVVEALWAGLTQFRWTAAHRVLLVLGDAPQHPSPRGAVTEDQVKRQAVDRKVQVEMILLPQTPTPVP